MSIINKTLLRLSKPDICCFTLLWLMVIVIAGTVAQKYVGLYVAQHQFFAAWFYWIWIIPLPAGYPTLCLLTLNLICKLLFASAWHRQRAGTLISHMGVLCLLIGGLLTALYSHEGSMTLYDGDTSNKVEDYHAREFVVFTEKDGKETIVARYPWSDLATQQHYTIPSTPLTIDIIKLCLNCETFERGTQPQQDNIKPEELRGRASLIDFSPKALEKEDESNQSGIMFRVGGVDAAQNGVYFSFDFIPVSPIITVGNTSYHIMLRKAVTYLPFHIQLLKFQKSYHPNTDMAQSYSSEVSVQDGATQWRSVISMNQPLRYKGYTFYQSSFIDENDRVATVLAVVDNAGRMFPYISGSLMCIGLLLHLGMQLPKLMTTYQYPPKKKTTKSSKKNSKKHAVLFWIAGLGLYAMLMSSPAHANIYAFDMQEFGRTPIMNEGRVKPLDTYARAMLKRIAGRENLADTTATEWLAEVLFSPEKAIKRRIFNIAIPDIIFALELEPNVDHRYSFEQLYPAIQNHFDVLHSLFSKPEQERTYAQTQLLTLYQTLNDYADLTRSLSLITPRITVHNAELAKALNLPRDTPLTYMELRKKRDALLAIAPPPTDAQIPSSDTAVPQEELLLPPSHPAISPEILASIRAEQSLMSQPPITLPKKAKDTNTSTDAAHAPSPVLSRSAKEEVLQLQLALADSEQDSNATTFTILPPQWEDTGKDWFSPWGISMAGYGSPTTAKLLNDWQNLLTAYQKGDTHTWQQTSQQINATLALSRAGGFSPSQLALEDNFNHFKPFFWGMIGYALSLVCLLLGMLFTHRQKSFTYASYGLLMLAAVLHGTGILARMLIMGRPPVTSLYESIIFVALTSVALASLLEYKRRDGLAAIAANIVGVVFLFIGYRYEQEGDTLKVLVAVLDTNFWLGTHVVCMTIGYATTVLGAILAHLYLILKVLHPSAHTRINDMYRHVRICSLAAIFFASLGTILGGIWADQSWGRFWGWDPKENGALLVVLWLAFIIHGRLSGILKEAGVINCMALANIIVALAWFGVNLLGVGLHSYGFTDGALNNLIGFCTFEILFVSSCSLLIQKRS